MNKILDVSYSQDEKYSINNSMVGIYKEENNQDNNSKSISFISKSKNYGDKDENENEEEEEISDIQKNSDNEDDIDYYDMINSFSVENNYSNYNRSYYSKDKEEDKNIIRRQIKEDNISLNYFSLMNNKNPPISVDIDEGFTQMVNKNIKKSIKLPYYENNEMIEVLMIAEKPSLARTISHILKGKNFRQYNECRIAIFTYEGKFQGKKAFFTVSSIRGHIYQDSFKSEERDESYFNVNKQYDEEIVKIPKKNEDEIDNRNKDLNIPQFLRNISKGKDILCLWLDCDPEGENICYEVIHNVYPNMNQRDYQQIYRAKFNSLTEKDIKQSFENLCDYPNKRLSMSVDARSIIDFKVGVCFTRLFSIEILRYIKKYNKRGLEKRVMSYGPCQTPTLWFCVQRFKERRKYIRKSYYKIFVEFLDDNGDEQKLYLDKIFDNLKELKKVINKLRFHFYIDLKNIKYKKKKKPAPEALKTTTMLKMASLQLGLSPYEASKDAQKLYMNGLISYPRTKSTKYSENYDFKNSLRIFRNNPHFSDKVNDLLENFDKNQIDFSIGEEKGGHQPIVPTDSRTERNIRNDLNWDLYKSICLYYFASLSPPMEYANVEYKFKIGKYKLTKITSKLIKKGFLNFMPLKNKNFDKDFPAFEENKHYKIINIDYEKYYYPPPQYLTEAELIDQMEKKNIGTDGSIPTHIRNLINRKYVKVDEHKRLIPTKLGITLIDSLNVIEPEIIRPENRAKIEEYVKQIETGEKTFKEAVEMALEFYKKKLRYCNNQIDNLREEFGKYFELIKPNYPNSNYSRRNDYYNF